MANPKSINVSTQRATFAAMLAALVTGLNADLLGADPYVVDGVSLTRAEILGRIQAALDAIAAVKPARTALQSLVARQKAAIADARGLRAGIQRAAQVKLGPNNPTLQKLGFTPKRSPAASTTTKAQAVAKATATREARAKAKALTVTAPAVPATPGAAATPKS